MNGQNSHPIFLSEGLNNLKDKAAGFAYSLFGCRNLTMIKCNAAKLNFFINGDSILLLCATNKQHSMYVIT